MGPKDVILKNLEMSDVIIKKYLDDLSDADLRLEGVPRHEFDCGAARPSDLGRADVRRVREPRSITRAAGRL